MSGSAVEFGMSFPWRMDQEAWLLTGWSGCSHGHHSKSILLISSCYLIEDDRHKAAMLKKNTGMSCISMISERFPGGISWQATGLSQIFRSL